MALQAANLFALVSVAGADKSISDLRRVSGQVNATQGVMSGLAKNAGQIGKGVGQLGAGAIRIAEYAAIAAVGAGVAAAKVSIDFEDAFANVRKTVEDTPEALAKIEQGLETLSTTIPVTFQSLTTIASEAGALGVKTKDIEKFTEAVARTSAATVGLDPFMASEAFGKLSTIFTLTGDHIDKVTGQVESDYERLGSALVALGNAGASSEAEIIDITKYFAQAGQQAGLSAAQVLAWGSALTSLGMEPEAGGGALQRVFQRITTYLGTSNKKADEWAKLAGMSTKEFAKAFDEDASGSIIRFLGGLKELDQFQGAAALKKAGIVNQRDVRAILALSNHIPVLTDQLDISTRAWDENTALMEVSEKRFDTLKAKITEFTNTVSVGADAVGDGMTPAIGRLVEKAKDFLNLHMGDLENLGKDIGSAIDAIDWGKVNQGAQTAVDLAKTILTIISKIPPEITAGVAAFSVLNKLSGGLLGAGAGNIVGGVLGIGATLIRGAVISALPASLRGVASSATVMHVWVDNMPGGGLGGTNVVGAGGGTSLLGRVATIASRVFIVGAAVGVFSELLGALHDQTAQNLQTGEDQKATLRDFIATGNQAALEQSLAFLEAESARLNRSFSPEGFAYQFNIDGIRDTMDSHMAALRNAIDQLERGRGAEQFGPPTPGGGYGQSGGMSPDERSELARRGRGVTLTDMELQRLLRTGQVPAPRSGELEGIMERALAKGFKPTQGAVEATYARNMLRQAEKQQTATERTTQAVDRTTAAIEREHRGSESITIPISITVPPVRSYQQAVNETRHYGPSIPNVPRHAPGSGPLE